METWWERDQKRRFRIFLTGVFAVFTLLVLVFFMLSPQGEVTAVYRIKSLDGNNNTLVFALYDPTTNVQGTLIVHPGNTYPTATRISILKEGQYVVFTKKMGESSIYRKQ